MKFKITADTFAQLWAAREFQVLRDRDDLSIAFTGKGAVDFVHEGTRRKVLNLKLLKDYTALIKGDIWIVVCELGIKISGNDGDTHIFLKLEEYDGAEYFKEPLVLNVVNGEFVFDNPYKNENITDIKSEVRKEKGLINATENLRRAKQALDKKKIEIKRFHRAFKKHSDYLNSNKKKDAIRAAKRIRAHLSEVRKIMRPLKRDYVDHLDTWPLKDAEVEDKLIHFRKACADLSVWEEKCKASKKFYSLKRSSDYMRRPQNKTDKLHKEKTLAIQSLIGKVRERLREYFTSIGESSYVVHGLHRYELCPYSVARNGVREWNKMKGVYVSEFNQVFHRYKAAKDRFNKLNNI